MFPIWFVIVTRIPTKIWFLFCYLQFALPKLASPLKPFYTEFIQLKNKMQNSASASIARLKLEERGERGKPGMNGPAYGTFGTQVWNFEPRVEAPSRCQRRKTSDFWLSVMWGVMWVCAFYISWNKNKIPAVFFKEMNKSEVKCSLGPS